MSDNNNAVSTSTAAADEHEPSYESIAREAAAKMAANSKARSYDERWSDLWSLLDKAASSMPTVIVAYRHHKRYAYRLVNFRGNVRYTDVTLPMALFMRANTIDPVGADFGVGPTQVLNEMTHRFESTSPFGVECFEHWDMHVIRPLPSEAAALKTEPTRAQIHAIRTAGVVWALSAGRYEDPDDLGYGTRYFAGTLAGECRDITPMLYHLSTNHKNEHEMNSLGLAFKNPYIEQNLDQDVKELLAREGLTDILVVPIPAV